MEWQCLNYICQHLQSQPNFRTWTYWCYLWSSFTPLTYYYQLRFAFEKQSPYWSNEQIAYKTDEMSNVRADCNTVGLADWVPRATNASIPRSVSPLANKSKRAWSALNNFNVDSAMLFSETSQTPTERFGHPRNVGSSLRHKSKETLKSYPAATATKFCNCVVSIWLWLYGFRPTLKFPISLAWHFRWKEYSKSLPVCQVLNILVY